MAQSITVRRGLVRVARIRGITNNFFPALILGTLTDRIQAGDGDPVTVQSLAEAFECDQAEVRKALALLAKAGLIMPTSEGIEWDQVSNITANGIQFNVSVNLELSLDDEPKKKDGGLLDDQQEATGKVAAAHMLEVAGGATYMLTWKLDNDSRYDVEIWLCETLEGQKPNPIKREIDGKQDSIADAQRLFVEWLSGKVPAFPKGADRFSIGDIEYSVILRPAENGPNMVISAGAEGKAPIIFESPTEDEAWAELEKWWVRQEHPEKADAPKKGGKGSK